MNRSENRMNLPVESACIRALIKSLGLPIKAAIPPAAPVNVSASDCKRSIECDKQLGISVITEKGGEA